MASTDLRLERIEGLDDQRRSVDGLFGILQVAVRTEERVTEIFELLRDPVYHYLLVIFRSPSEAEDIAQETFLQLYLKLHRCDRIDNARFWVFRVAHNLAINRQKHERVYQQLSEPSWDEVREHLSDTRLNPEQLLLKEERMQRLHAGMGWLSGQEATNRSRRAKRLCR